MTADIQALRCTLGSREESLALRFRALFALKEEAEEGREEAVDAIAAAFEDDSALLKHELAYVLGQSKNLRATPYLQAILKDEREDLMVRHEAAEALGALSHEASLPLLEIYLHDPSKVIQQTCELAISRIKWQSAQKEEKETIHPSAFSSIDPAPSLPTASNGTIEVRNLRTVLCDQSQSLFSRYRAMFRLRDIGTPGAIDALACGFDDPSALFRHEIAYVFGQLSDPHSIPALQKVLCNASEEAMVRHEAAEALGSIATDDVLPVLQGFIQDKERVVRESAVVALDSTSRYLPPANEVYEFARSNEVGGALLAA